MTDEVITCDRCKKKIDGFRDHGMTAGFYDTSTDLWGKFANPGEKNVCDDCMWSDPRYQAVYGQQVPHDKTK